MTLHGLFSIALILFMTGCTSSDPETPQQLQLGKVLILSEPGHADADMTAHLRDEVMPVWNGEYPAFPVHAFRADRGAEVGTYLLAWSGSDEARNTAPVGTETVFPGEDLAGLEPDLGLDDPLVYTEYEVIGEETAGTLPAVELLGIHRIEVIPEQADAFGAYVRDSIYTTFADRAPGMRLMYYRGLRGADAGGHLLIFTFDTIERREEYFPTGAPETEALTRAFEPMLPIGDGLAAYQVEGSYLDRSTGLAAAMFEAVNWTDFAHVGALTAEPSAD